MPRSRAFQRVTLDEEPRTKDDDEEDEEKLFSRALSLTAPPSTRDIEPAPEDVPPPSSSARAINIIVADDGDSATARLRNSLVAAGPALLPAVVASCLLALVLLGLSGLVIGHGNDHVSSSAPSSAVVGMIVASPYLPPPSAPLRGLCKVSPSPVLVRRQPFIGPVGQGCQMGCQLHVNFYFRSADGQLFGNVSPSKLTPMSFRDGSPEGKCG